MNAFNRDIEPNKAAVLEQLTALFPPEFVHPYPDALVEIAYGTPGNLDKAELFSAFKLDAAAEFAIAKNRRGCNVYVGPTLKKGETAPFARTKDKDFLAGLWAWTDHDAEGDFDRAKGKARELNLSPGMIVDTGTVPHLRAHAYFKMSGAVTDAEQLRAVNKSLQSSLGGDPVQAPSHVMRLAGTINYPTPKKAARGYVVEPVKVRVHRAPHAHSAATLAGLHTSGAPKSSRKSSLGFDLPRNDAELLALLEESRKPGKWHTSMRSAIATIVGRGWSDAAIRLACAPYCNGGAGDPDLTPLIDGARNKWDKPNEERGEDRDAKQEGGQTRRHRFETLADLRALPPTQELIEHYIPERSTGLLIGKWGTRKTFMAFDWTLHLCYGLPDWHGWKLPGRPIDCLIIAREGAAGFVKRIDAFKLHHNIDDDPTNLIFMRAPVSFANDTAFAELKEGIKRLERPFKFAVVDTVGRAIPGVDMAKEQYITLFMERLQQIGEVTGGTAIGVHHENKSGDATGSMYFQNNSDFMLSNTKEEAGDRLLGKITCLKSKDDGDQWSQCVEYKKVELADGKSSLVVESVFDEEKTPPSKPTKPVSNRSKLALAALDEAVLSFGRPAPPSLHFYDVKAVEVEKWRDELFARGILDRAAKNPRTDLKRIKDALAANSLIGERDGLIWRAK